MAHSRAGAGNVQDASGASWYNRHLGSAPKTKKTQTTQWWGYIGGTPRANQKNYPRPKLEKSEQQNIVLDNNPKFKRSICESMLI